MCLLKHVETSGDNTQDQCQKKFSGSNGNLSAGNFIAATAWRWTQAPLGSVVGWLGKPQFDAGALPVQAAVCVVGGTGRMGCGYLGTQRFACFVASGFALVFRCLIIFSLREAYLFVWGFFLPYIVLSASWC